MGDPDVAGTYQQESALTRRITDMKISPIAGILAVVGGVALATTGTPAQDSAKKPNVRLQKTMDAGWKARPIG